MQMIVQLHHVVTDITGETGMRIIRAVVVGERDPVVLATHRDRRCHASEAEIAVALAGNWREEHEEHVFALGQAVELYDAYHAKVVECDLRVPDRSSTGRIVPAYLAHRKSKKIQPPESARPRSGDARLRRAEAIQMSPVGADASLGPDEDQTAPSTPEAKFDLEGNIGQAVELKLWFVQGVFPWPIRPTKGLSVLGLRRPID